MFTICGITGKVGGAVAKNLRSLGKPVRGVVRDAAKAGPDDVVTALDDVEGLARAFNGAEGAFFILPPDYDPAPGFPAVQRIAEAVHGALERARPGRILFLSTVGAQVKEPNLLNNSAIIEAMLREQKVPFTVLRAAWFMENTAWDVAAARSGVIPSYLQPLEHKISMVATADLGRTAAELLVAGTTGLVELEGPARYSAADIGRAFAEVLGHPVRVEAVPHADWETNFRAAGMKHPLPRIRMLDGFNEGWVDFEGTPRKGPTQLLDVIRSLTV